MYSVIYVYDHESSTIISLLFESVKSNTDRLMKEMVSIVLLFLKEVAIFPITSDSICNHILKRSWIIFKVRIFNFKKTSSVIALIANYSIMASSGDFMSIFNPN